MFFIWDTYKYIFERKLKAVADYYKSYGKYPSASANSDIDIRKLGIFINLEKEKMRDKNISYPEWKMKLLEKYLPDFSKETFFDIFLYYVKIFKDKHGNVDIKYNDVIEKYNIGKKFNSLKERKSSLSEEKIKQLEELGVFFENKNEKNFKEKLNMAQQAIIDGVVIDINHQKYCDVNLYNWLLGSVKRRYIKNELSDSEAFIVEGLVNKSLHSFFNNGKFVKIVDIVNNREIAICKSYSKAIMMLEDKYNIKMNINAIPKRILGKVTTPYKGRFMFYYATDEEVKKYLEDSKAS